MDFNEQRDLILETFSRLSAIHGMKKITVDMVARESGISKKTVYKYFSGKSEIIRALIDEIIGMIKSSRDNIKRIQKSGKSPDGMIEDYFDIILRFASDIPAPVIGDAINSEPGMAQEIEGLKNDFTRLFVKTFNSGIELGVFNKINPVLAERFYLGAVNNVFDPQFLAATDITIEDSILSFKKMLMNGLLKNNQSA